jgi:hemoglobin-like flavoprotein
MGENAVGAAVAPDVVARAKASYERCCARPRFLREFYRHFLASCPEAEPMFANTDFDRQTRLLKHALGLLLIYPSQPAGDPNLLERVAERHSRRDLDVSPEFYDRFVDSLLDTAREHDPLWTVDVEAAWRSTVSKGIAYMQSRY